MVCRERALCSTSARALFYHPVLVPFVNNSRKQQSFAPDVASTSSSSNELPANFQCFLVKAAFSTVCARRTDSSALFCKNMQISSKPRQKITIYCMTARIRVNSKSKFQMNVIKLITEGPIRLLFVFSRHTRLCGLLKLSLDLKCFLFEIKSHLL